MSPPRHSGRPVASGGDGRPPINYNVPIIPTFLSTDLVCPGREVQQTPRDTLPAIGVHQKTSNDYKLWGQETKGTSEGYLAYSYFKPSHCKTYEDNVLVSHRHYDNRITNNVANDQPYVVTPLLLSKCRLNDQMMPPPLESEGVTKRFIPEPIPAELRNSYFSHRCKFQVFPTAGVDLHNLGTPRKDCVARDTTVAMEVIKDQLYSNTTYQTHFQQDGRCRKNSTVCKCNTDTRKENLHTTKNCRLTNAKIGTNQGSLNHRVPDLENCTCVRLEPKPDCPGCPDCAAGLRFRPQPIAYSNLTSPLHPPRRIDLRPLEFPVWPSYPPGNNITNYPDYPKVILPKYCIHDPRPGSKGEAMCGCKRVTPPKVLTPDTTATTETEQEAQQTTAMITEKTEPSNDEEQNADVTNDEEKKTNPSDKSANENDDQNDPEYEHSEPAIEDENLDEPTDVENPAVESHKPTPPSVPCPTPLRKHNNNRMAHYYKDRGFKTNAHHKYHAIHANHIPDLRDAAKEGRKHNFFGYNAHVFRG